MAGPPLRPAQLGSGAGVYSPDQPGFGALVSQGLAGVGDSSDHFDSDLASTILTLASMPAQVTAIGDSLASALSEESGFVETDPGLDVVLKQALTAMDKAQAGFTDSLGIGALAPAGPTPPSSAPPPPSSGSGSSSSGQGGQGQPPNCEPEGGITSCTFGPQQPNPNPPGPLPGGSGPATPHV